MRAYERKGIQVTAIGRKSVDLLDRDATFDFIKRAKPDVIVDAAAKVGGIVANDTYPVEFLADNLRIQNNLLEAAFAADVEKFIFLGSRIVRKCEVGFVTQAEQKGNQTGQNFWAILNSD